MITLKSFLLVAGSISLLFLGACSSGSNQTGSSTDSPATSSPVAQSPTAANSEQKSAGGMVVESGAYHLELLPEKQANATHLDLYVQRGDNHEAIPNAKVTAQVQLPDGSQKSVDMTYDAAGKHYTAEVPSVASGEYKVAVQSEIGSEKVNARYTFKQ